MFLLSEIGSHARKVIIMLFQHSLLQSSVDISNYNITSLIYKLTTGEEYSPSATNSFKLGQSSFQDGSSAGCCEEMINEEAVGEDFHSEGGPQGGDCAAGAASRTGGPLFSGE